MGQKLDYLFSPIRINGLELDNRAVMPAMGTGYGGLDGSVTDRLVAFLARRARGGTGLIITEVCAVDPRGKGFPTEIGAWSDELVSGLRQIPEAVHREGGRVALQLHHAGRETMEAFAGATPEAPSAIPSVILMQPCEEMSIERIAEVVEAFASAAGRASEAGFDAVEIHGAHGYLVGQFLSPLSNQRTDKYGGSGENRARFAIQVVEAVRGSVGPDFPVLVRVSVEELARGGYGLSYMEWLAPLLVASGADAIHASVGVYSTPGNLSIASMDTGAGFNLHRARAIKRVVGVPVIGVGRINDPALADDAIGCGDADLISFGRQHLADPDFIAKARAGAFDDIRVCLACNQGCIERLTFEFKPITCTINPGCGEEYMGDPEQAEKSRRVWVIGAGPAGLSAALCASRRGHMVSLLEKDVEPGGQLLFASRPPNKGAFADWVSWAVRRLEKQKVELSLGTKVCEEMLRQGRPDAVILATGAVPAVPELPGIHGENVFDARRVLAGAVELRGKAIVLGAGYVGMETADYLIDRGVQVTVIEMRDIPPVGKHTAHGYWLHLRLRKAGGELMLGTAVRRIEPDAVVYEQNGEERRLDPAPLVVTAMGANPVVELVGCLENNKIPYQVIGDAVSPRRLIEAVHEGYAAGLAV